MFNFSAFANVKDQDKLRAAHGKITNLAMEMFKVYVDCDDVQVKEFIIAYSTHAPQALFASMAIPFLAPAPVAEKTVKGSLGPDEPKKIEIIKKKETPKPPQEKAPKKVPIDDLYLAFERECILPAKDKWKKIIAVEAYSIFKNWCEAMGSEKIDGNKTFYNNMRSILGAISKKSDGNALHFFFDDSRFPAQKEPEDIQEPASKKIKIQVVEDDDSEDDEEEDDDNEEETNIALEEMKRAFEEQQAANAILDAIPADIDLANVEFSADHTSVFGQTAKYWNRKKAAKK